MASARRVRVILCMLVVALLAACLWRPAAAARGERAPRVPRVLVLNSYHPEYPWTRDVLSGVMQAFEADGRDLAVINEYMDTKRHNEPDYLEKLLGLLTHKFGHQGFDAVLVADNNAFDFALAHREELFPDQTLVFCGVNRLSEAMLEGQADITGVAEVPAFAETMAMALKLRAPVRP